MSRLVIDNTNLLRMCNNCGAVGFVPALSYVYDAVAGTLTITNASTIPAGDTLKVIKVRVHDFFGGEVRDIIEPGSGGDGYAEPPTVNIIGDGAGATAHAVMTGERVTGVVVDVAGTGYTVATVEFVPTAGGSGALAHTTIVGTDITAVTMDSDAGGLVLDVTSLNRSKKLAITASIFTVDNIAADGGTYGWLQAAGDIAFWDVQKNA